MEQSITAKLSLEALLHSLIEQWESEVVEFKRAGNDYSTEMIGNL